MHFADTKPGLIGIGTTPVFAIGQRALLLRTGAGNVLWDCISFIDDATLEIVQALGGIAAIAISHPHFYASMVEWSRAFDRAPIYLHAADKQWVVHPDTAVTFWDDQTRQLAPGVTLLRCGGHFAGGTVLHWGDGAGGKGALLSGDIVRVGPDRKASFMRSYPDLIPLDANSVTAHRGRAGGLEIRRDLRRHVGQHHPIRWQGSAGLFGPPLSSRDQRAAGRIGLRTPTTVATASDHPPPYTRRRKL